MLDAIIAFGSAFMLSQTYFGANSVQAIIFGMSLLSVVCVGIVTYHREEQDEAEHLPHSYFKKLTDFTTFILGVSSIVGLVASGVGLALLFAPMSGARIWQQSHVSVGWAEIVTIGLTVCQMMLTLSFYNQCKRDSAYRREGAIVLVSAAEAIEVSKPFLEKGEEGLTSAGADELALRHVLYA